MHLKYLVFSICLWICLAFNATAQTYSYKHFTILDGLVQNQVMNLYQDHRGFIWIGTKGGVSRFDGVHFKNYTSADGVPFGWGNGFFEIKNKLYYYSPNWLAVLSNDQFKLLFKFKKPEIFTIKFKSDTTEAYILFGNKILLANKSGIKNIYSTKDASNISIVGFNNFLGKILVLTKEGIYSLDNRKLTLVINKKNIELFRNCENTLYFAARNTDSSDKCSGIFKYANGITTQIFEIKSESRFTTLDINSEGNIFFQTSDAHWKVIDSMGNLFENDKMLTITSPNMICDREGNILQGSETGLYVTQSFAFRNYGEKSGIPTYIWSIMETKDSAMIFANFNGTLCRMKNNNPTIIPIKNSLKGKDFCFYMNGMRNSKGECMLPTNKSKVFFYDGQKIDVLKFKHKNIGFSPFSMYEDTSQQCVIFGLNCGLCIYNMNTKVQKFWDLPSQNILSIEEDKFHRKWICSNTKIYLLEHDSLNILKSKGFKNDIGVVSCKRDQKGNMWLATKNGLCFYNWQNEYKISNDQYFFICLYKNRYLIAGTVKGFLYIDLDEFYNYNPNCFKFFDRTNGFIGIECGQNGTCIDSKGNVWIPTSESVVKFMPEKLKMNKVEPCLNLYSFEVSDVNLTWETLLNEYADLSKTLDLTYDKHNVKIVYQGISLSCPEKVRYKTRLVGYDNDWSEATNETSIVYTNLSPGDYIFEILSCNSDKVWTSKPLQVKFCIHPAFWQTWWFFTLFVILLVGVLVMIFRWRTGIIKKHAREKQEKIQLRLNLLQQQFNPHFIDNCLNSVNNLVSMNDELKTNQYLSDFSSLMRLSLNNSNQEYISFEDEIEGVRKYLQLEFTNNSDRFTYHIDIDDALNQDELEVTPSMAQPFIENAIKHAFPNFLTKKGFISIKYTPTSFDSIKCTITDNGIGKNQSIRNKTDLQKQRISKGEIIVKEKLALYNSMRKTNYTIEIIDLADNSTETGTKVIIFIPMKPKNKK
ncbi:MAG: histidine kinase [Bacteroidota bacterium]